MVWIALKEVCLNGSVSTVFNVDDVDKVSCARKSTVICTVTMFAFHCLPLLSSGSVQEEKRFYIMLDKINSIHLINGSIKILLYLVSEIYQFCFWRKKLPYLTVDRKKEFKDVIVTKTRLKNCWYYMCKSMLNHKFSFCVTSWKSQQVF